MTATPHSEKGIETLELMNSDPMSWQSCPVKWEWRTIPVNTRVICSNCDGRGYVDSSGKPPPSFSIHGAQAFVKQGFVKCDRCYETDKHNPFRGIGWMVTLMEREVLVGTLLWPEGTKYTSRFEFCDRNCCGLCGKTIKYSGMVPMLGKDNIGGPLGMWVGQDCARKLWGVAVSSDWSLVSRENAIVMRDTNRATEADKERRTEMKALRAAKALIPDPITGRAGLNELALNTPGINDVSVYKRKNSIEVKLRMPWVEGHERQIYEFKITAKGGAKLVNYHDDKILWQDKSATDATQALIAAIAMIPKVKTSNVK